MNQKATILRFTSNTYQGSGFNWSLKADISITSGDGTEILTDVTVHTNQFNGGGGGTGWKPSIKAAIVFKAQHDYGITVDQVLFLDLTVL